MTTEFRRQQQRRGTAAQWGGNDQVLLAGEIGLQTGPGTGEARAKVGDGVTAFSALPWVFEVDQVARDAIAATDAVVFSLDSRLTVVETAIAGGGTIDQLTAQVAANTAAIALRQLTLPVGANPGDVLHWDGTAYAATALAPAPGQGTMLFWDVLTATYRGTGAGAVGQALILQPGGAPGWGNPSTITVTLQNQTIPLTGGASVQDAFNAAAPTIDPDAVVTITWGTFAYHYIGAPGIAITTAVAADFTLLGTTAPSLTDAPVDGTPYVRQDGAWVPLVQDLGEDVLAFDFGSGPPTPNQSLSVVLVRPISIPDNFAGARGSSAVNPASTVTGQILVNAVQVGSFFAGAAGLVTFNFVTPGAPLAVAAGARVTMAMPGTIPANFAGFAASLVAARTT